jgi:hypothetical protein
MIKNALRMSALGVASLLVAAPALAQVQVQVTTPEMPAPPALAPPEAPISEVPSATSASPGMGAMALAPKAGDDLSGSIGFGVGVIAGPELVGTNSQVGIKYWSSDTFALAPSLKFGFAKQKDVDASWNLDPELVFLFAPYKSTSTRFEIGAGLGLGLSKGGVVVTPPAVASTDTAFNIYIPIQAGVEHFFTRWFSVGIAARSSLFTFRKQGDAVQDFAFAINSTNLLGQLFFYTD